MGVRVGVAICIQVTRRVKGYTRFVGKYVTGRRKRFRLHKIYIFLSRITSRVDLTMSVCPYERWELGNYKSYAIGIWHADSWDSRVAQVCFSSVPRQAAQNCGSYSFDARVKIVTEINCSHLYLAVDPKKSLPRPLLRPVPRVHDNCLLLNGKMNF